MNQLEENSCAGGRGSDWIFVFLFPFFFFSKNYLIFSARRWGPFVAGILVTGRAMMDYLRGPFGASYSWLLQ